MKNYVEFLNELKGLIEKYHVEKVQSKVSIGNITNILSKEAANKVTEHDKLKLAIGTMQLVETYIRGVSDKFDVECINDILNGDYCVDINEHNKDDIPYIINILQHEDIDEHIRLSKLSLSATERKYEKTISLELITHTLIATIKILEYFNMADISYIDDMIENETHINDIIFMLNINKPESEDDCDKTINYRDILSSIKCVYTLILTSDDNADKDTNKISEEVNRYLKIARICMGKYNISYSYIKQRMYNILFSTFNSIKDASSIISIKDYSDMFESMFGIKPKTLKERATKEIHKYIEKVNKSDISYAELIEYITDCICLIGIIIYDYTH